MMIKKHTIIESLNEINREKHCLLAANPYLCIIT